MCFFAKFGKGKQKFICHVFNHISTQISSLSEQKREKKDGSFTLVIGASSGKADNLARLFLRILSEAIDLASNPNDVYEPVKCVCLDHLKKSIHIFISINR